MTKKILSFCLVAIFLAGCGEINDQNSIINNGTENIPEILTSDPSTSSSSASSEGVVKSINVTDFAYYENGEPEGPFDLGTFRGKNECDGSVYASSQQDNIASLGLDAYAFAEINDQGKEGDRLIAKWFFELSHRPLDEDGQEDLSAGFIHDSWVSFYEEDVAVFTTCGGNLYAYSLLPSLYLREYCYDEHPLGVGGSYKVIFYQGETEIGEQIFDAGIGVFTNGEFGENVNHDTCRYP